MYKIYGETYPNIQSVSDYFKDDCVTLVIADRCPMTSAIGVEVDICDGTSFEDVFVVCDNEEAQRDLVRILKSDHKLG